MSEKISKKEVEHIAQLAHLEIDDHNLNALQKDMEKILDYIDIIEKAEVSSIKPTSHTVDIFNVLRKDSSDLDLAQRDLQNIEQKKFQDQAPGWENDYFKVKPIFKARE